MHWTQAVNKVADAIIATPGALLRAGRRVQTPIKGEEPGSAKFPGRVWTQLEADDQNREGQGRQW